MNARTAPRKTTAVKQTKTKQPAMRTKPIKNKILKPDATKKSATIEWQLVAPLDASLEFRPVLRPMQPGERSLELGVQVNHATLQQPDSLQVDLRLRAEILVQEGTLALAEIHYIGVAKIHSSPESVALLQSQLYPIARSGLRVLLQLAGQEPPLPDTLDAIHSH